MNSEWCTFSYPMYCECKLVVLTFGWKVFVLILGIKRVLVWNLVRMTQSRIGVIWMDEITWLMFAIRCFMLGNDRILFWSVLWCELGKVGVNWMREQTWNLASLAQAGPPRPSESCKVSLWFLVRVFRLGDQEKGWMIWSLAQMRGTRLGEVTRKPGSFERDISPKREVLSSERWTLSPRREWLA